MSKIAPVTILGGLPVFAEVSFYPGDGYATDDDAEVDELYWMKRNGKIGKPVSRAIWDRLEKKDAYWQCDVIDQVIDQLSYVREE